MKFNFQNDKRWSYETMTSPPNQKHPDFLWRWGCINTTLANNIQFLMGKRFTPKDMNDVLKQIKAYNFLDDPNCKTGYESLIVWEKVKKYFASSLEITLRMNVSEYNSKSDRMYIAKVIHQRTNQPHYINVLQRSTNYFICFDVESKSNISPLAMYKPKEIIYLHEIRRK